METDLLTQMTGKEAGTSMCDHNYWTHMYNIMWQSTRLESRVLWVRVSPEAAHYKRVVSGVVVVCYVVSYIVHAHAHTSYYYMYM